MANSRQKTGYLNSDFRIFYLTNTEARDFQSHYHDFHKLLYFESGSVSYYVEGETYQLQPGDLVLVSAGEVHRPVIQDTAPYHRLILYLAPAFFEKYKSQGIDLAHCFSLCSRKHSHVLRLRRLRETPLEAQLKNLILSCQNTLRLSPAAHSLFETSALLQFLLLLNSISEGADISFPAASGSNQQVLQALSYINAHLLEELSVDQIADACFLNRSYLMHLFRRETGYTLGSYITEKRLFAARSLIQAGGSVTDAALTCGFPSYTAFYRAYRKKFGEPPKGSRKLR
ncbi:MAG: AraC family transcriptional regulator [Lachnospiraceae bacterium]|nr:AraC family transcriptional regulator [Lachnospiraceae bacterium]